MAYEITLVRKKKLNGFTSEYIPLCNTEFFLMFLGGPVSRQFWKNFILINYDAEKSDLFRVNFALVPFDQEVHTHRSGL